MSSIEGTGPLYATLETSLGRIVLRLYEEAAPRTVANFVGLATGTKAWRHPISGQSLEGRPFYDGTTFHRCLPNFMIQGGDPLSNATDGDPARASDGGPGYSFEDELRRDLRFDRPGVLGMANGGESRPNSNGSQFFVTEVAAPHLTGKHTIFGEVVSGFERVPKIARTPVGADGLPVRPVVIQRVTVTRGTY